MSTATVNAAAFAAQPASGALAPLETRRRRQAHIINAIIAERERQELLAATGQLPFSCAQQEIPVGCKYPVLGEEAGEVGTAVQELQCFEDETGKLTDNLEKELIQTAAVCVAWLEALEADKEDAE